MAGEFAAGIEENRLIPQPVERFAGAGDFSSNYLRVTALAVRLKGTLVMVASAREMLPRDRDPRVG